MAVALLLIMLVASFVVVRIGAVALELTGMSWSHAKFQALSAFTNAGFTTRESEEVVSHPVRRRIVSYLIVAGNAGLVTTMASLAGSLVTREVLGSVRNLAIIIAGVSLLAWLARRPAMALSLRRRIRRWLGKRFEFEAPPDPAELLRLQDGFTLVRLDLHAGSPAAGKTLAELDLKDKTLQVLAIERGAAFIPVPRGQDRLTVGDHLIVYGASAAALQTFEPRLPQPLTLVSNATDSG